MDDIRARLASMGAIELDKRAKRLEEMESAYNAALSSGAASAVLGIVLTGLTLSVLLFSWLLARPGRSDPRRVAGMLADYGLIAAGMV
ncbi:hypothetical protein B8W90_11625, partial [Staphylococcus hominis]